MQFVHWSFADGRELHGLNVSPENDIMMHVQSVLYKQALEIRKTMPVKRAIDLALDTSLNNTILAGSCRRVCGFTKYILHR